MEQKNTNNQEETEKKNNDSVESEKPREENDGEMTMDEIQDAQINKAVTYLSYVNLLCLIPLFGHKESEFAQFHAKRGLVLVFIWYIGYVTLGIGLGFFICLGVVVLSVMGLIQVSEGTKKGLPIVDEIVKKLNL